MARPTGATFIEADAAVEADAPRTIAAAQAGKGHIDVLVNNAGGATGGARMESVSLEDFDQTLAVHVLGAKVHMKHVAALVILETLVVERFLNHLPWAACPRPQRAPASAPRPGTHGG